MKGHTTGALGAPAPAADYQQTVTKRLPAAWAPTAGLTRHCRRPWGIAPESTARAGTGCPPDRTTVACAMPIQRSITAGSGGSPESLDSADSEAVIIWQGPDSTKLAAHLFKSLPESSILFPEREALRDRPPSAVLSSLDPFPHKGRSRPCAPRSSGA